MPFEAKYALLSADLVNGKKSPFVHNTEAVLGTCALLHRYGLEAQVMATGVMKVRCNGDYHPALLVPDETWYEKVKPGKRVAGMLPAEWRNEGLVVVDMNWDGGPLTADLVIQSFLVSGMDLDRLFCDHEVPAPAREAAYKFYDHRLDEAYRLGWYAWLRG